MENPYDLRAFLRRWTATNHRSTWAKLPLSAAVLLAQLGDCPTRGIEPTTIWICPAKIGSQPTKNTGFILQTWGFKQQQIGLSQQAEGFEQRTFGLTQGTFAADIRKRAVLVSKNGA